MTKPDFQEEKKLWDKGIKYVIGIDEVGRGAFAGPIVVGAVIFDKSIKDWKSIRSIKGMKAFDTFGTLPSFDTLESLGINDSKLLTAKRREKLDEVIKENCLAWDITEVSVGVINRIGIGKATEKAMRITVKETLKKLKIKNCLPLKFSQKISTGKLKIEDVYVLIDGFHVKYIRNIGLSKQKGITKGDRKSISIAAASIIAKVYRDDVMRRLAKSGRYKRYRWDINKGYGTEVHRKMILQYGMTHYHRKMFVNTWLKKLEDRRG